MQAPDFGSLLLASTTEVLETMFFSSVLGELPDSSPAASAISTRLAFLGEPAGTFGLSIPPEAALSIAANFLGEEESCLTHSQIEEVVCELTNMICGSLLSRMGTTGLFELHHPVFGPPPESASISRSFELDDGHLTAWLMLAQPI